MNIFKKAYCRIFQKTLWLALPLLPYKNPKILDSVDDIPALIKEKKLTRPLVVTDKSLFNLGALNPLTAVLEREGIQYAFFSDVVFNPTVATVEAALKAYKESGCDCLVAFGGGSPMDTAKAVGARVARPKKQLNKMKGILKVRKKIPYLIAVPTTCGTGSETTLAAVIVDDKTRHKYAINDFPLIPKAAVLDARVIATLPPSLVASTGLDALTHAVEAFIGKSTTKSTRRDALEAIGLIFENIVNAYEKDQNALAAMLKASHLAGRAFTKSYVGYVHALAHALGGAYNLPHGLANAVLLPVVLREYGKYARKKLAKIARITGIADKTVNDAEAAEKLITHIEYLEERLSIPKGFDCIKEEDIPALATNAEKEANPLYPVPKLWGKKQLEEIYHKVALN